jgi:hypothetical protein
MPSTIAWILIAVAAAPLGRITSPTPTYSAPLTREGCEALREATQEVVLLADPHAHPPALKCVQVTIPTPGAGHATLKPARK